jgi:aspartyl-tRNA(Asn)/glutamyl-tRNA(Gln) amidotransferase subunit A
MTTVDLGYLSIAEAAAAFRRREFSPVELTRALLERIERLDPILHAFVTITADRALAEARDAEARLVRGDDASPLLGIPVAHKDIYATAGVRTAAGSAVLTDWFPDTDATAVARWQAAGTVMLGKLITHEFAIGIQWPDEHFPPARNPWDTDRIPSGSSSGSGAALAAGLCMGATGSDTGGSIRGPAAFCALTGLKPTYGRISRAGVVTLAWSLDHVGPMARSALDCAHLLQPLAGHDPLDPASATAPVDDYVARIDEGVRGLRIGVPRRYFFDEVTPEIEAAIEEALRVYRSLGAEVREIDIPSIDAANVGVLIMLVEAFAYHQDDLRTQPGRFGKVAGRMFRSGGLFTGGEYLQAQRMRSRLCEDLRAVFREVDLLLAPAALEPPTTFEETYSAPRRRRSMTIPFNMTGSPALALPCGFTDGGLPLGMQIVGPAFGEALVLRAGHAYQRETDWHLRRPPIG